MLVSARVLPKRDTRSAGPDLATARQALAAGRSDAVTELRSVLR